MGGGGAGTCLAGKGFFSNPYLREPKAKDSTVLHFCKFPWKNGACRMFKY